MKKWTKNWTTPVRVLLAGAGIAVAAILVPMVVSAVAPSAGQVIGNQAAASYKDASGTTQTATSNQVNTTVAQVGNVTLSNTGNKTAAAGNTVSVPHTLTNSGNGTDTFNITTTDNGTAPAKFSNVVIFADPNGTGTPTGAPLCATPNVTTGVPLCSVGFTQTVAGNNGTFNFVVAYTIPSTATTPLAPFDTATVTATPAANTNIPYVVTNATRTDTVNLTTSAAFASTKSIAQPAVGGVLNTTTFPSGWPAVVTSGNASASTCTADIAGVNAKLANCTYTVYTLSYNNTGGATGSFYIEDKMPTGITYVPGTAVWSANPGTALPDSSSALTALGGISTAFDGTSKTFKADVASVPANTAGTISFVVMINSSATVGTALTNNIAAYSTTPCDVNCANGTPTTTPTNPSPFPINTTYSVIAANASTVTATDTGIPPTKTGVDLVDVASAFLGGKVVFTDFIINKGNATDTFNVKIADIGSTVGAAAVAANNFPAGTTFAFFKTDGVTPLLDTNGDGVVDTGPLSAAGATGNSVAIVVVATLPKTVASTATGPFDALMTATSVGAGSAVPVIDSVWNQLDAIKSAKVDLTNTSGGNLTSTNGGTSTNACTGPDCDLGQGPSTTPTFTTSTTPGTPAVFPIYVTNEVPGTSGPFNLTGNVPPGYTVKFIDPTTTATCAAGPFITSITVAGGATGPTTAADNALQSNEKKVLACVTPPAGTTPGTVPVTFTATSTDAANPATDTITDAVKVTQPVVPAIELGPNTSTGTTPNGGTTVTPVTVTNTGTTSCGVNSGFNVSVALDSASAAAGWTATVYYDANKNGVIDATDIVIDTSVATANLTTAIAGSLVPLAPAPGNVLGLPLLVKLFAPTGATIGSTATATLTVTDLNSAPTTDAPKCPATSGKYSATVTNGQISVQKTQVLVAGTGVAENKVCNGAVNTTTTTFDVTSLKVSPGDCIVYKVVATNAGNAVVKNVVLSDAVPSFTNYNATQPTPQCVATNTGTGSAAVTFAKAAGAVSCSGSGTDGVILNPTGTVTLYFAVQVQQ